MTFESTCVAPQAKRGLPTASWVFTPHFPAPMADGEWMLRLPQPLQGCLYLWPLPGVAPQRRYPGSMPHRGPYPARGCAVRARRGVRKTRAEWNQARWCGRGVPPEGMSQIHTIPKHHMPPVLAIGTTPSGLFISLAFTRGSASAAQPRALWQNPVGIPERHAVSSHFLCARCGSHFTKRDRTVPFAGNRSTPSASERMGSVLIFLCRLQKVTGLTPSREIGQRPSPICKSLNARPFDTCNPITHPPYDYENIIRP